MPLETARATYNAAVDTLMAAWETLNDAVAAGEEIEIVFLKRQVRGGITAATGDPNTSIDASLTAVDWDFGKKFRLYNTPDVTDSFKVAAGIHPLFFKVTNPLNELS